MKAMIVVTHLLGTGHLTRAMTLAHAFVSAGHRAIIVSGGVRPATLNTDGINFVQLPPVRSDGIDFGRLLDANGVEATDVLLNARSDKLQEILATEAPDALITELFPFGRRILRREFLALLDAAQRQPKQPKVFASIRDILAPPSKPKKVTFAQEVIATYYDGVLVHADPALTPLSLSWPVTEQLKAKLRYTGFVTAAPAKPHPKLLGHDEIIVSAGGGDVGNALFSCAKEAAAKDPARTWRLLVGGQNANAKSAELQQNAPANLIAEPARPEFRQMLHHAAGSVSLCGYNTALDILQTCCPAVFVPFDEGAEVEQGIRADALAQSSGLEVLHTGSLTAQNLLETLAQAMASPRTPLDPTSTYGASRTVEIVAQHCGARDEN
ncbi:MAG: glycosyltransferase family protein [Sulfitobacter sp.]